MPTSSARPVSRADFATMRYGASLRARLATPDHREPVELSTDDALDLMDGAIVNAAGTTGDVDWIPASRHVLASDTLGRVGAGRPGWSLVRLGERPRVIRPRTYADTYINRRGVETVQPHVNRRYAAGLARVLAIPRLGIDLPMPEHGLKPSAPVDTLDHGRSTDSMEYREALGREYCPSCRETHDFPDVRPFYRYTDCDGLTTLRDRESGDEVEPHFGTSTDDTLTAYRPGGRLH